MTGYSGSSLPWKLGVKPGPRVSPVKAPQNLPTNGHDEDCPRFVHRFDYRLAGR
ncbi:hypothetical protein SAMN05421833_113148 [Microbispora rosea]|uniref:Uncharacterized protein n=1 Tax=Microbispora rosea TaxID=58117 RepID=A0A1N7D5C4_9ACTN|nr:hypothetical protein Mro03_41120 [Microbispora rosea subsp. rosea]SIR71069.1 hypothetical protein SAMN05421833_113148 [Microbispora rosea]